MNLIEFEDFGWNMQTLSAAGTAFFAILASFWGLKDQAQKIWKTQSGKSVSTWLCMAGTLVFIAMGVYGFYTRSGAMMFNAIVRTPFSIFILWGIYRFEGLTRKERAFLWASAGIVIALILIPSIKGKQILCAIIFFGTIIPTIAQPLELRRKKHVGALSIKMIIIFLASSTFWVIYMYEAEKWFLFAASAAYTAIFFITCILYLKYET